MRLVLVVLCLSFSVAACLPVVSDVERFHDGLAENIPQKASRTMTDAGGVEEEPLAMEGEDGVLDPEDFKDPVARAQYIQAIKLQQPLSGFEGPTSKRHRMGLASEMMRGAFEREAAVRDKEADAKIAEDFEEFKNKFVIEF